MAEPSKGAITALLKAWKVDGSTSARDELFSLIERDLHDLARRLLRRRAPMSRRLQPTELVNELYLKLAEYDAAFENRHLFYGLVSRVIRHVLIDLARRDRAAKRVPSTMVVDIDVANLPSHGRSEYEIVDFYVVLDRLRVLNPRHADILERHGLLGLTLAEAAETVGVSHPTAKRDFQAAKAWFRMQWGARPPASTLIDERDR